MTTNPSPQQWIPSHPSQPTPRPRNWRSVALALIAIWGVVLGATALVVALTCQTNNGAAATSPTTDTSSYTAEETTLAHQKLGDAYKLAARAVQIQTNGDSPALAGVAAVNGALMLHAAVGAAPALASADRTIALALADAYSNTTAVSSFVHRNDQEWRAALTDVNAKDARMKALCGGG
ncbi:hypothetical protein [Mycobacterium marinum]|uniref:hypothetical protein n=1 Tax=Mycobacterium marinum TaxID=1781 RepID=UPI0005629746|nr:hypothetical protein [Mycobacterium marinum]